MEIKNKLYCYVPGCCNTNLNKNISFYFIPRNEIFRKKWIEACNIHELVTKSSRICSNHFNKEVFHNYEKGRRRKLRKEAIPKYNLPSSIEEACKTKTKMFGKEAIKLIAELDQSSELKPFNENGVRDVIKEMESLYNANLDDANASVSDSQDSANRFMSVQVRHAALNRDKRCLLAYVFNRMIRLRKMRWEFGSLLPTEISSNMSNDETQWFQAYNRSLVNYMRTIGEEGLNLTADMTPPKSLFIEVRCLADYGKLELEDGQVIALKKNSHHLLPRAECESLIRQGVLEHVVS